MVIDARKVGEFERMMCDHVAGGLQLYVDRARDLTGSFGQGFRMVRRTDWAGGVDPRLRDLARSRVE